jgi:hypothetical protein
VELQYVSSTSAAASSESSTLFGSETTISANSVDNKDSADFQVPHHNNPFLNYL